MEWEVYELVYRALSPIRIGWRTLGYIDLARYWIPGKNIWAAFTENLARSGSNVGVSAYEEAGKLLKTSVLPTYFHPAIEREGKLIMMMPIVDKTGLRYGPLGADEFERVFVASFAQTAILPHTNSIEEESLHESEYLAAEIIDSETNLSSPVLFIGYLLIHPGVQFQGKSLGWADKEFCLEQVLSEIFVGGERKYGWGRLKLKSATRLGPGPEIFGYRMTHGNGDSLPAITIPANGPLPAHVRAIHGYPVKGQIEPLVGREWAYNPEQPADRSWGPGQKITEAGFCWMPGSILVEEKTLSICSWGILG